MNLDVLSPNLPIKTSNYQDLRKIKDIKKGFLHQINIYIDNLT